MDLLDRYLRTVRMGLPARERDDITRELRENLLAQVEDREAELGRALDPSELRRLLTTFGHPLEVAARYRSDRPSVAFGRELIGPLVWPYYSRVIAIAVSLAAAAGLIGVLLDRDAWTLAVAPGRIALPIALSFTTITATFAGIDRWIARRPVTWDPDLDLPFEGFGGDRTQTNRNPLLVRLGGAAELVLVLIGLGLWLTLGRPGTIGDLEAGPGWTQLWVPVLVATLLSAVAPLLTMLVPARQRLACGFRIAADTLLVALAAWSLALANWVVATPGATLDADEARFMELVNGGVAITLAILIAVTLFTIVGEVRKLRRLPA